MAEEKKIIIEILDSKGKGEDKDDEETEDEGLSKTINKIFHPIKTAESAALGKNVFLNQVYQTAKQQTIQAVSFYHDRYFSLKEDYLSETTYHNAKTAIGKVSGFAGAVGAGAMAGSSLGVPGAVIGAAIGAVGFGISEQISKMQTISTAYQQLNANDMQTSFLKTRAGLNNNNRNTEN